MIGELISIVFSCKALSPPTDQPLRSPQVLLLLNCCGKDPNSGGRGTVEAPREGFVQPSVSLDHHFPLCRMYAPQGALPGLSSIPTNAASDCFHKKYTHASHVSGISHCLLLDLVHSSLNVPIYSNTSVPI